MERRNFLGHCFVIVMSSSNFSDPEDFFMILIADKGQLFSNRTSLCFMLQGFHLAFLSVEENRTFLKA